MCWYVPVVANSGDVFSALILLLLMDISSGKIIDLEKFLKELLEGKETIDVIWQAMCLLSLLVVSSVFGTLIGLLEKSGFCVLRIILAFGFVLLLLSAGLHFFVGKDDIMAGAFLSMAFVVFVGVWQKRT